MSLRADRAILVVSCYELGRQPLAAATALAFLERAGFRPRAVDLALEPLDAVPALDEVRLALVSVPMHTALHVGVAAARRLRRLAPRAHVVFWGLYAVLNAEHLLAEGLADEVEGGEAEQALVAIARRVDEGSAERSRAPLVIPRLERLDWLPPAREALPPPERYARLVLGEERLPAAAVETTRGCLHRCRHCPIPPVYDGRLFVIPREHVLADVRRLVQRGVRHVTFADPDFFCGPGHAMRIVRELHREHPALTFDATIKVEHLLRHRDRLRELAGCGCLFVVSAVESLSDEVLGHLDKGHTRADVFEALALARRAGIALRPSFVAFTPWTLADDYLDLLDWIEAEGLAAHVDTVQLSIRLLVPPGSLLADHPPLRPHLRGLDAAGFSWRWVHPDPRMDRLHVEVERLVRETARADEDARVTFARIRGAAQRVAPPSRPRPSAAPARRLVGDVPRLTEPWFC